MPKPTTASVDRRHHALRYGVKRDATRGLPKPRGSTRFTSVFDGGRRRPTSDGVHHGGLQLVLLEGGPILVRALQRAGRFTALLQREILVAVAASKPDQAEQIAMATTAVKKLARYCCNNCGGSELYLYCWKGCRHVQNIKTFYAETKSSQQELEMLRATIYEQEIRFREYELLLKEKEESLEFLVSQVNKLPRFYPVHSSDDIALIPLGLPTWSLVAAKMVWQQFDGDHDGKLASEELRQLKDQMRTNHENVDEVLPDYLADRLAPTDFLKLYECGEGAKFSDDLRSLGILCGLSEPKAESLSTCDAALSRITMESRQLQKERDNFQKEFDESKRAKTRLQEVFAASKQSLEDQARDLLRLQQQEAQAELQLRFADEIAVADAASLSKAKRELSSAKHALLDLRALVDDQIAEKEKWQRYCWDLEERLHEATNASHVKERDLWRTKDAKKEESRKNMLLYIEAQKGKRHFSRPAEPAGYQNLASSASSSATPEAIPTDVKPASMGNNLPEKQQQI